MSVLKWSSFLVGITILLIVIGGIFSFARLSLPVWTVYRDPPQGRLLSWIDFNYQAVIAQAIVSWAIYFFLGRRNWDRRILKWMSIAALIAAFGVDFRLIFMHGMS